MYAYLYANKHKHTRALLYINAYILMQAAYANVSHARTGLTIKQYKHVLRAPREGRQRRTLVLEL